MSLLIDGQTALFAGLIDYAGLFPPALLPIDEAVAGYRRARGGRHAWMLGRFLAPTSRLEDLVGLLTGSMAGGEAPWSVGAILDEAPGVGALHAQVFDRHMSPAARVDAVEARLPPEACDGRDAELIEPLIKPLVEAIITISPDVMPYFEVARTAEWESGIPNAIDAIASLRHRMLRPLGAKLRTGGIEAGAFPSPEQVARFISACHAAGVPYKATAGLHHPMRHLDEELSVMQHGFLNMLAAAALARAGGGEAEVAAVVGETSPGAFVVTGSGLRLGERRIPIPALREMRDSLFPAYGSCSFDEPVADLTAMGILD